MAMKSIETGSRDAVEVSDHYGSIELRLKTSEPDAQYIHLTPNDAVRLAAALSAFATILEVRD